MPNIDMGLNNDFTLHIKLHGMCANAMMRLCKAKTVQFLSVTQIAQKGPSPSLCLYNRLYPKMAARPWPLEHTIIVDRNSSLLDKGVVLS